MEIVEELNLGNLDILPNELRYKIIKLFIKDNIESLNNIIDFRVSMKAGLDKIKLICKSFNIIEEEELKNLINKLKIKKFKYLKGLNQKLTDLLKSDSSKKNLEEAVGLIVAGADIKIKIIITKQRLMLLKKNLMARYH